MDQPLAHSGPSTEATGVLTQVLAKASGNGNDHGYQVSHVLALDAEERTRSRLKFAATDGTIFKLELPRGTVLYHGDLLRDASQRWCVKVEAKPEPVTTVRAADSLMHLRAAYHLGNRHVPLEITAEYLRFSPDSVLEDMVRQMGLTITKEVAPFQPEPGAYHGTSGGSSHNSSHNGSHKHAHSHTHSHNHDNHEHSNHDHHAHGDHSHHNHHSHNHDLSP